MLWLKRMLVTLQHLCRESHHFAMSSIDALWSELKEEELRMRRTPKASAGVPSFSTHLAAPPDNATIATAGIAGTLGEQML